jgi:UDP-3-O-[3-hydroxymyristoyl] glucosamine N-acyltransferase
MDEGVITVTVTVREVATWIEGELLGDGEQPIREAKPLADAEPGDITFVENDQHLDQWHTSRASAAIVKPSVAVNGRPIIRVDDPLMAFAAVMKRLRGQGTARRIGQIHPTACVAATAKIDAEAILGPFVVIGDGSIIGPRATLHAGATVGVNCRIGSDVTLHGHVTLYDGTVLGDRVTVHANSVIGADGYGYRSQKGQHVKVPQLGWVEIGDDVEIGALTTIDRGTFGPTRIGEGTKIDNHVMIGHNCQIGRHNLIVAQAGIAGSCVTGDYCVLGGQVGIADHVTLGDRVQVGAQSGVFRDIPSDSRMLGSPAHPDRDTFRMFRNIERLGDLFRDVKSINKHLGLEGQS